MQSHITSIILASIVILYENGFIFSFMRSLRTLKLYSTCSFIEVHLQIYDYISYLYILHMSNFHSLHKLHAFHASAVEMVKEQVVPVSSSVVSFWEELLLGH